MVAGSCLCGEVHYEIAGDFDSFYLCHCSYCRKDTGSAHAANLFASAGRLNWLSGAGRVRIFKLPGTRHVKSFCSACGSAVPTQVAGGPVVVPAGSLDDAVPIAPTAHLFLASKAAWEEGLATAPGFAGLPVEN